MTVRRRDILSLLPGAALGWSFEARAQQARKLPVVGFLFPGFSAVSGPGQVYSEFITGLRKVGFVDGESVRIEARFAEGQPQRLAGMAGDLVRLNVDVLLAALAPDDEHVLRLAIMNGLDGVSLAKALKITPGAARVRLHRALGRLRVVYTRQQENDHA